jgi:hypothetical protein
METAREAGGPAGLSARFSREAPARVYLPVFKELLSIFDDGSTGLAIARRRIAFFNPYMDLRQIHLKRPCIIPSLKGRNRRQSKVLRAFIQ